MGKLSVLHISDVHIGNTHYDNPVDIAIQIIDALENHNKKEIGCVVISGDIFDGKTTNGIDRKKYAIDFMNYLKQELSLSSSDFVITPGNHDLIRKNNSADFSEYKSLLESFYGKAYYNDNFNNQFLFHTKIFEEKKVAFISLNSCMVESCKLEDKDIKWIDEIDVEDHIKDKIKNVLESNKKNEWDDYGFISKQQLREAFKHLESQIKDLTSYTIVACFHHHFYPFPEIYNQYGDGSIIRNFTDVIDKFQSKNVKIVLHGHKHMPIVRPVTNHKYLLDPDSIFYVLSAGSISKKGIENRSFQQLYIYSPDQDRVADVCRFNYKQEELQSPEEFSIPPKKSYEQNAFVELLDLFKGEFLDEYEAYCKDVYESDNISQQNRVDEIISNISQTITLFKSLKDILKSSSKNIQLLLYSIHYRINYLHNKSVRDSNQFLAKLKDLLCSVLGNDKYSSLIIQFLEYERNKEFEKKHDELFAKYGEYKKDISLITVAIFFTDLYLTFIKYGEVYFNKEKLAHSINIKLESGTFHQNIPISTIKIVSDTDRRLATIQFKCKNPTVHKIAVLIVKDYEKRISKIEDSFKCLGLKIYYLIPKVDKEKGMYELENLNFEAYIPTLLPLLTGENLYKKREVFIRELIQNSLDAILLRENIVKKNGGELTPEEKIINIEIGLKRDYYNGSDRKYLKIQDNGIGMDSFKIERYFTSIGRSFYQSEEFEELQKNESIQYNPISNFGIGFLSAFMVSGEIEVITRSYDSDYALEIHIPNYEGCFFIKKVDRETANIGTSITLYEDGRKHLSETKIIDYIKDIFSDFQLKIRIDNQLKNKIIEIDTFALRRNKDIKLFCPIVDDKTINISWLKEIRTNEFIDKYQYGVLLQFDWKANKSKKNRHNQYLNSGILLSNTNVESLNFAETINSMCFYNFPSSYISLDVAREKILTFKNKSIKKDEILKNLASQGLEVINSMEKYYGDLPIKAINDIVLFFKENKISKDIEPMFYQRMFQFDFSTPNCIYLKQNICDDDSASIDDRNTLNMIGIYTKIFTNIAKLSNSEKLIEYADKLRKKVVDTYMPERKKGFSIALNILNDKISDRYDDRFDCFSNEFFLEFSKKDIFTQFNRNDSAFNSEILHVLDRYTHAFRDKSFESHGRKLRDEDFMEHIALFENDDNSSSTKFIIKEVLSIKNTTKSSDTGFDSSNKYYNVLLNLVLADFLNNIRRKDRIHLRVENIYSIFRLFYDIISQEVTISNTKSFLIQID